MERIKVVVIGAVVVGSIGLAVAADAALKERFEKAAAAPSDNCDTIPYDDLLKDCREQHDTRQAAACSKEKSCKREKTQPDCKTIVSIVKAKETEQKTIEQQINDKKEQKTKLEGKSGNVEKVRQLEREIDDLYRKIDDLKSQMFAAKRSIIDVLSLRRNNGRECKDARQDVIYVFRRARGQVNADSDSDLAPFVKQLNVKYDASIKSHEDAVNNVQANMDTCDTEIAAASGNLDGYCFY